MFWGKNRSLKVDIAVGIFFLYVSIRAKVLGRLLWGISPFFWMAFIVGVELVNYFLFYHQKYCKKR